MKYFANWKLNFNINESITLAQKYLDLRVPEGSEVTIIPSIFAIGQVQQVVANRFKIFSQDISVLNGKGSNTGEVTATILKECGIQGSLLGHIERRVKLSETSVQLNQKIRNCLEDNLEIVLVIGEFGKDQFSLEEIFNFLKNEMTLLLKDLRPEQIEKIVFAYESSANISSPLNLDVNVDYGELHQINDYIISMLRNDFNVSQTTLLYGGSVHAENIKQLKQVNNINGFLIGKASQDINQMQIILDA